MGNVIGHIVYDGTDSRDFGVLVGSTGTHVTPQRAVESVYVPGRNGALTIDKGRFDNVNIVYQAMILNDFVDQFDEFKAFLFSRKGYARLEDSFDLDHFRLARINKSISPSVITFDAAGKFKIPFDCDPRRFLKSGEEQLSMLGAANMSIYNPTYYDAKPLIQVTVSGSGTASGTITVNGKDIEINDVSGYVVIDLETMNAYNGSINMNDKVSIPDGIALAHGDNAITTLCYGVSRVEITPRWWTI